MDDKNNKHADHPAVVYFAGASVDGPIKIGVSTCLPQRIEDLQTGSWEPLKIFGVRGAIRINSTNSKDGRLRSYSTGAYGLERAMHDKLRELGFGLMGEWFDVSAEEAITVAQKCGAQRGLMVFSLEMLMSVEGKEIPLERVRRERNRIFKSFLEVNNFAIDHNQRMQKRRDEIFVAKES